MLKNISLLVALIMFVFKTGLCACFDTNRNEDVLSRLFSVERVTTKLQQENEYLRVENRRLHMDNKDIRRQLAIAQDRLDKAQADILTLKSPAPSSNLEGTTNQVDQMEQKPAPAKNKHIITPSKNKYKNRNNGKLKSRIKDHEENEIWRNPSTRLEKRFFVQALQAQQRARVSFSANLQGHATGLGADEIIKFNVISNNEGGAYNATSGTFVCPVNGTYFFTATILSFQNEHIQAYILHNRRIVGNLYAAGSSGSDGYDQGSNSVVLFCKQGDHVWIQHDADQGTNIYGHQFSHFSGFILWAA